MLVARVLDPAVEQVAVELRLVDRVHRADAHRHRRELPEVRHEPRVRVGRQRPDLAVDDVGALLTETVEVFLFKHALEEGPRVHPRSRMPLEEDLVTATRVVLAAEEVVHPDFVERRSGRIGRDVPADAHARALSPVDHHGRVPADPPAVGPLDVLVTGEPGLTLRRDGVDVVGRGQRRHPDLLTTRGSQQLQHEIARPGPALLIDHSLERVEPFLRLFRIGVRELARNAVEDRPGGATTCHGGLPF
ncbi:MAG: hypothetical protein BWY91_02221 [bacterium ADurb.BinA028]|nr:MAG: hypothetical protein BWY91_02221 [bacterium ADurb.BinA028]